MDIDGLHKLIEQCNTFNAEKFKGVTELINAQNTRTRGQIEDIHDRLKDEINVGAKRLDEVECYIEKNKKQKWMIAGGVTVIGFISATLISLWTKIFG